jgi:hypothetical protein
MKRRTASDRIALVIANALMTAIDVVSYYVGVHLILDVPTGSDAFLVGLGVVAICHNNRIEDDR